MANNAKYIEVNQLIENIKRMDATKITSTKDLLRIVQTAQTEIRPIELYAIENVDTGKIIFNARGGCYKQISDALKKLAYLTERNSCNYRIVIYRLDESRAVIE